VEKLMSGDPEVSHGEEVSEGDESTGSPEHPKK
jgi:hypothetical protein